MSDPVLNNIQVTLDDDPTGNSTVSNKAFTEYVNKMADNIGKVAGVPTEEDRVRMAKDFSKFLRELIENGKPSEESLAKERSAMVRRLNASKQRLGINTLLASAGIQGANQNMVAEAETANKLDYLLSQLESNPKAYANAKMVEIASALGPAAQGFAGIIANATHGYSESANAAANLTMAGTSAYSKSAEMKATSISSPEESLSPKDRVSIVQSIVDLKNAKGYKKDQQAQATVKGLYDILNGSTTKVNDKDNAGGN